MEISSSLGLRMISTVVLCLLVFLAVAVAPGTARADDLILTAAPLYSLYLNAPADLLSPLSLGGNVSASLPFPLFGLSWLRPVLGVGYVYSGLAQSGNLMAVEGLVGLEGRFPVVPWLDLKATLAAHGGYYMLNSSQAVAGFSPGGVLDAGADFRLGPAFQLGLGAQAVYDAGMFFIVRPYVAASLRLKDPFAQQGNRYEPAKEWKGSIDFLSDGVFPVFFKYYDDHPFAKVTVSNKGESVWTDVKVTFSMKQFMDAPSTLKAIPSIEPGKSVTVDLVALFNDGILSVTEATKVSGELTIGFRDKDTPGQISSPVTLRVYDRNAMTWDDDRRPAAFVTAKDPAVLGLAKSLAGDIRASMNPAISEKLQLAAGVHEALCLYGVNYVTDPTSVISGSKTKTEIDFLQFPRQTLEYRSGDCDDLSILYAAVFESLGAETAFLTIPGHIFMAVSLGMTPEEAKDRFSRYDDLIARDGMTWLPIEITLRKGGFLAAWTEGAREWRESASRGQANLYPVHAAWSQYEPVALPGSSSLAPLANAKAVEAMKTEIGTFITKETAERVAKLQADARKPQGATRALNSLGVLYARYGLYDKAKAQFESVLQNEESVAALVNLGNIHRAQNQPELALEYYNRAYKKSPANGSILLAEAMINQQLQNYGTAKKYYDELKATDPATADRYAYLGLKGEEGTKAAEALGIQNQLEWIEEK